MDDTDADRARRFAETETVADDITIDDITIVVVHRNGSTTDVAGSNR